MGIFFSTQIAIKEDLLALSESVFPTTPKMTFKISLKSLFDSNFTAR